MGSSTYEWILDHEFADKEPADWKWPYDIPCWVFTSRELQAVPERVDRFVSGDVAPVHAEMVAAAGGRNVWIVGGGDLVGQFADAGLLDEVIVYSRRSRSARAHLSSRAGSSCSSRRRAGTATS